MIKSFSEIDNNLFMDVCNCFEKDYNFNSLIESYPYLDYNVLYSILNSTRNYNKEIYNYLYQVSFDDSKIIIMSDTHYGSVYEDMNYTYSLFDFAIANGIRIILHGGDIIESDINNRRRYSIIKQANDFINKYPYDDSIITYAIFGNHDYLAINKNETIKDILCSRDDINMLGFKKAYLKWCGNVISLHHEIENFKLNLPIRAECLCFRGHSHFYHIKKKNGGKNERIFIPSMCNDPVSYISASPYIKTNNIIAKPGFLTAEINGSNIVIVYYSFSYGEVVKENEFVKVLKR